MVQASRGTRRKTRHIMCKRVRDKGMTPITHEFRTFEVGEKVNINVDPGVHYGMPNRRFQGKTGVVKGSQGRAFVVAVRDGDKMKTVISRPEHLQKSL